MRDDDQLIQRIYDAAMHTPGYESVLQDIADRTGVYGAMVFDCTTLPTGRRVGVQHLSTIYDPDAVLDYARQNNDDEVADQDRFADLSSAGNEINLIHDRALYSNSYPQGANVDAMLRRGVGGRYGALLSKENWNTDRFAFQMLHGAELPAADKLAWAESILAHLAKSLSIARAISGHRATEHAMSNFFDTLPVGIAIVNPSGQLLFSNQELKRIADSKSTIKIAPNGQFSINADNAQSELAQLLTGDDAHGRFGARPRREAVFVPDDIGGSGLFIEICPVSAHPELDKFGAGTRLVSVFDGAVRRDVNPEIVARFFPLSKSEVEVLGLVSEGYSNAQIAEHRSRSIETVNSQLKSLLRKTSSRNRTELVKVAMGLSTFSSAA